MFLLELLAKWAQRHQYLRLYRSRNRPERVQLKILQKILHQNATTEIGKSCHFSTINDYATFKKQVPVQNANQYKARLKAVYQGEYNELLAQAPHFFAMTAGSTGEYKYIPINKRFKHELEKSVYAFYYLIEQQCPELANKPIQFLVGSAEGGHSPDGIRQGFVSGFNYQNLPGFIRRKFIIPYWVFTLENLADRYYTMARYLADCPELTAIGAFSPTIISNVPRFAIERGDQLIQDLQCGTLTLSQDYQQKPHNLTLKKNSQLAQQLSELKGEYDRIPETHYVRFTQLIFPALKYFATWMGGNMKFAYTELERYCGGKDFVEMPFSASEGIFGVPFRLNYIGGIAAVTSHFLEFIPEDEIDNDDPTTLGVWQLEQGHYYYLVVTTSGGLYRYSVEDLVLVKDYWGQLPILQFISKRKRQISISNERINENDVTNSVVAALEQQQASVAEFVLMPTHDRHYKLLVDQFTGDLTQFVNSVEANLREIAMGYDFEREDLLLKPMSCAVVAPGTLKDYVQSIQSRSTLPSAQFKPVHLANDFALHHTFTLIEEVTATEPEPRQQYNAPP